jgi:hypothetical protein
LQFLEMTDFVNQVGDIRFASCFDLDGQAVAEIRRGIDVTFTTITCVSNHDENSNRKERITTALEIIIVHVSSYGTAFWVWVASNLRETFGKLFPK